MANRDAARSWQTYANWIFRGLQPTGGWHFSMRIEGEGFDPAPARMTQAEEAKLLSTIEGPNDDYHTACKSDSRRKEDTTYRVHNSVFSAERADSLPH